MTVPQNQPANAMTANAMTVDVEDYYQVSAMEPHFPRDSWPSVASRVERNTARILELFAEHEVTATFFTLGCVAEKYPQMTREIVAQGHELASHGYEHVRVTQQDPESFRKDARRTKLLLEDLSGSAINGYRAASFSIGAANLWAFEVLQEVGYRYSSSVYPVRHDLYGMPEAPRFAFTPDNSPELLEIPMTTLSLFGGKWPCGGGGFFRLLPYAYSSWALRRVNRLDGQPGLFYFHPWEIDPGQPRVSGMKLKSRFRHYVNLTRMEGKLARLCRDFRWDRMDRLFAIG